MKKTVIFILFALSVCPLVYGSDSEPIVGGGYCPDGRNPVAIHIRYKRGNASIDTHYLDNKVMLDSLVSLIGRLASDPQSGMTITLKGSASPDGTARANRTLAEKRAAALRAYILRHTAVPASAITTEESDIDWTALKELVAGTDRPWRDEAVSIISDTPIFIYDSSNRIVDGRQRQLGMLHGGAAWAYMESHFFDKLRNAGARLTTPEAEEPAGRAAGSGAQQTGVSEAEQPAGTADKSGIAGTAADTKAEKPEQPTETTETATSATGTTKITDNHSVTETAEENRTAGAIKSEATETEATAAGSNCKFVIKTNMLYDLAAVPNVGIEIPIGERWSVGADWMYAWWKNDRRHRYLRIYGGSLEVRRWFPTRRHAGSLLTGHHVGLYGQMFTYDLEWGGKGYLGDKWSWGVGAAYGYSLPVGKRLNIDFTIGVGYQQGEYMTYHPEDDCYVWDATHNRKWFGPTKAEISLVWFIGGRDGKGGSKR